MFSEYVSPGQREILAHHGALPIIDEAPYQAFLLNYRSPEIVHNRRENICANSNSSPGDFCFADTPAA